MAVQSLVSAPTSRALGLISGQGSEIPLAVCNGIKGDKTNTLKQETNYKPQTNGRYKIRQVLTKKWEIYAHVYTHKQNQNSGKKKVEEIDPVSKGK